MKLLIGNNKKPDPTDEGIRNCLRCGKPTRIIEVDRETFHVEINPVGWDAEHQRLVVKYDMHHPNCEVGIKTINS